MFNPEEITYFAETDYRNKRQKFGIKAADRTKHVYTIGKTGMGKSTMLENMAAQDIQHGNGFAFLDPHGSTAETLLEYIPEERLDDVLYFAPHDLNYPVSFNVMEDVGADKRHLVVAGLMSTFEKIWEDQWSSRMAYILQNTLGALLEYPDATLLGVNRMYVDKNFRKDVIKHVTDPGVKSFWVDEFAGYTDRFAAEATPAIQNKLGQFTSNPMIRNIIGQPKSSFDLRKMMDEGKIIIVNLSKGQVGESNANLLGSMLITKLYLAAMSRADLPKKEMEKLPNFYLFVDEFQSFANKSFADILSEARKYKLNLTIAHQYIEQMSEEVRAAVFGNVGTMISFRIGAYDAEIFEKEFAPQFTAEDLVNLGRFQIYLKLMVDGISSAPFSAETMPPIEKPSTSYEDVVIARSREHYAHTRAEVEENIKTWHENANNDFSNKGGGKKGGQSKDKQGKQGNRGKGKEEQERELRKAMSLEHLKTKKKKKKKKKGKGPSQENVRELREALKEVLNESSKQDSKKTQKKDQLESAQESGSTETQMKGDSKNMPQHGGRNQEPPKDKNSQPKEVPEHLLRKILEVDKPPDPKK